jgi:DNA-binding GntR family transcriptional regulator
MAELSGRSLSDQAEQILKEEILSGRIPPGERIDIPALAESWKVSQTPIREAVKILGEQGLIDISPRRGSFVAQVDRTALREIFELRIALESATTRLATPRVPQEEAEQVLHAYEQAYEVNTEDREAVLSDVDNIIHDLLIRHCGNGRLIKIIDGIRDHVRWAQHTSLQREPYSVTLPEHIRIAKAVCARDVDAAVEAMVSHLSNTLDRLNSHLDQEGVRG